MSARKSTCPTPGKLCFSDRAVAESAMRSPHWQNRLLRPIRVYWCRGGHYHMTSQP